MISRSRFVRLLVVIAVIALTGANFIPIQNQTVAGAASNCGCAGDYVSPAAKAPSVKKPSQGANSPKGTYNLSVSSTSLTVTDAKTKATILQLSGFSSDFEAGFGPNDSSFVVWSLGTSGGKVSLYNLAATTPSHVVWSNEYLGGFSVGFSPHGKYLLVAAPANAQFTDVKVVDTSSGSYGYNDQVSGDTRWGFSPDDVRLALWTGENNATTGSSSVTIILFDLTARQRVWFSQGAYSGVSVAFSPHGNYFASAAISSGSQADLVVVPSAPSGSGTNSPAYQSSFSLYAPPGKDKDKFGSAAWGFGPTTDDSTFVYDTVGQQGGADVVLVNLTTRSSHPLSYPDVFSGWWKFSPCGDVFGIVIQPSSANSVDVSLYVSSTGQVIATNQFSSLNVSLKATESYHVATVDGTDHNLAKNDGHANCDNSGGSGNGSGGNGNGTSGNGNSNGGGNSGTLPCPSCYTPKVVITDLQVSPIALTGGAPATGTLTTTTGGPVSLTSSDPSVVSVPAALNTVSGSNTFTITTHAVTTDTLITITADGGDTPKTARLMVLAACSTANPSVSASVVAAAPIAGNGGGPGGRTGGGVQRPLAQITVSPMAVTSGGTVSGAISLSDAANSDTTFTMINSDATAVTVPASVVVLKGQKSATFTLTALGVTTDEFVTIGARAPGYLTRSATLAVVRAPVLDSLTLDASSVEGGTSVTGTVTMSGANIGCQEETVSLLSSDAAVASVPDSVTIPAGSTSATFSVQTNSVTSDTGVTIEGTLDNVTRSASLSVTAPAPPSAVYNDNIVDAASLDIPGSAIGDTNLATMESGEPVLSGTCAVLSQHHLENSVWFKLTPAQSGILTVSTANAGTNFDSVLALYTDPGTASVASLGTPVGCDNNGDALTSTDSNSSDVTLRSEEHTGPGSDKGTMGGFPDWSSIMHVSVTAGQTYYLQLGGVGGAPSGHYVLTAEINPTIPLPNLLSSVSPDSPTVAGGTEATGTVTLSQPAPEGGVIVSLSGSDDASATVPETVVVPAGVDHATFTVETNSVAADASVTITASFDGAQRTADLTVSGP